MPDFDNAPEGTQMAGIDALPALHRSPIADPKGESARLVGRKEKD
jgi:hypothetical protein